MPTQNGIEAKIDFLVQEAKDGNRIYEERKKDEKIFLIGAGVVFVILIILTAGLLGYSIGYDAAVSDTSAKLVRQSLGFAF